MIPIRKLLSEEDVKNNIYTVKCSPMAVALKIGTGGIADIQYLNSRQERGYKFLFAFNLHSSVITDVHLSAQHLIRIKQTMKPSISELANLFEVSRQTIYNWLSGEEPSIENVIKIENLLKTANFLADNGLTSSQILKRKIIGTESLFDIIQKGGSSIEAAKTLVNMLQNEKKQRELLEQRLKDRKSKPISYDDYGSRMLD